MSITFRRATRENLPELVRMNQQLIIDEQSHNRMSETELAQRMHDWLDGGRHALLIVRAGEIIGYMLYYRSDDEFYPYQNSIYVRQYFIKNSYRRRGIGQEAFRQIVAEYFPPEAAITLDVVASNIAARQFWERIGFAPYHVSMRREADIEAAQTATESEYSAQL
ncbi:MAG: GNAT family N-acetyltransferase [Aggregatilineales bacterium]